jgi:hypothetical protein
VHEAPPPTIFREEQSAKKRDCIPEATRCMKKYGYAFGKMCRNIIDIIGYGRNIYDIVGCI